VSNNAGFQLIKCRDFSILKYSMPQNTDQATEYFLSEHLLEFRKHIAKIKFNLPLLFGEIEPKTTQCDS